MSRLDRVDPARLSEVMGGGGHTDPEIRGKGGGRRGGLLNFFPALWASVWSKNIGGRGWGAGGPSPGFATEASQSIYVEKRWPRKEDDPYHHKRVAMSCFCFACKWFVAFCKEIYESMPWLIKGGSDMRMNRYPGQLFSI